MDGTEEGICTYDTARSISRLLEIVDRKQRQRSANGSGNGNTNAKSPIFPASRPPCILNGRKVTLENVSAAPPTTPPCKSVTVTPPGNIQAKVTSNSIDWLCLRADSQLIRISPPFGHVDYCVRFPLSKIAAEAVLQVIGSMACVRHLVHLVHSPAGAKTYSDDDRQPSTPDVTSVTHNAMLGSCLHSRLQCFLRPSSDNYCGTSRQTLDSMQQ